MDKDDGAATTKCYKDFYGQVGECSDYVGDNAYRSTKAELKERERLESTAYEEAREGASGAVADLLLREGRHRITVKIERCDRSRGFLYVGVMAADERTAGWPARPVSSGPGPAPPLARTPRQATI